ncbi:hypothetical protein MUP37_04005, partial [Candidatus Bathyarchaeota archaeon]|nr:hypothetical protein [Candidatus Bathyarchaeota archaeon]
YCAVCPGFQQRNTTSMEDLEQMMRNVEAECKRLTGIIDDIVTVSSHTSEERRNSCRHFDGNYCLLSWNGVPNKAFMIGKPYRRDSEFYMIPNLSFCAHCYYYSAKNAAQT